MTCAPWLDVGRRTASVAAPLALGNNLAMAVWGKGPLRNPSFMLPRPLLVVTRGGGHAFRVTWGDGTICYAMAYRPDRSGD